VTSANSSLTLPSNPLRAKFNIFSLALLTMGGRYSGPFTPRKGGVRFAVVAVDYFTKWVEVEPLVNITAKCIEGSYGKMSSAVMVCHTHSSLTMGSSSTATHSEMVCRAPHQKLLFISWTSSGKWASGSYQQDHFQNFEKEVG
jgi:hypothetical protein